MEVQFQERTQTRSHFIHLFATLTDTDTPDNDTALKADEHCPIFYHLEATYLTNRLSIAVAGSSRPDHDNN